MCIAAYNKFFIMYAIPFRRDLKSSEILACRSQHPAPLRPYGERKPPRVLISVSRTARQLISGIKTLSEHATYVDALPIYLRKEARTVR